MAAVAPVITLDGPSGSGKGTIAHRLASHLGWHLLDSGALYRLVGLCAVHHNVNFSDEESLTVLAQHMDVQFIAGAEDQPVDVILEGENVTRDIRTEEAGKAASAVAKLPGVREGLLKRQHDFCEMPGLIADGRDMGTVVFPNAELKIYLTASVNERADRRCKQLQERGMDVNVATLRDEIQQRDDQDMNRPIAPLVPADDAVTIDSSSMSIQQVFDKVIQLAADRNLTG